MSVLAIDPGQEKSGVVIFDRDRERVTFSRHMSNEDILEELRGEGIAFGYFNAVAIEDIEGMGFNVGRSVFETCKWVGRFMEASEQGLGIVPSLVSRGDEKIVICGCKTYIDSTTGKRKGIGDKHIRAALLERFPATGGGKTPQIGTKKEPGPLYGVSGHCWQALAVAITSVSI